MTPNNMVQVPLHVTAEDCRNGHYGNVNGCPVNLAMRRIIKPGFVPLIGGTVYRIQKENEDRDSFYLPLPNHFKQVKEGKDFVLLIQIDPFFLNEQTLNQLDTNLSEVG